ncbi:MAG: hypothetical protein OES26_14010 [Gammaproteobacteria bacterium]|nr:hypothetical protein [Gammaproteobacteria bacterium]
MKRKILITSIGSLVGSSIVESLYPRRHEWFIVGVNSQPIAVNNFSSDVVYLVPETTQESAYIERMRSILRAEKPSVVLIGRDFDLSPLNKLRADPEFKETLFLMPSEACEPVLNDKNETWVFANHHKLPFAATASDRAELDTLIEQFGFPLICKPRFGHGSLSVFIVTTVKQAYSALSEGNFVFQEFLSPPQDVQSLFPDFRFGVPLFYSINEHDHYSAQGLVGSNGELLAFIATLSVLEGGKSISARPIDEPALEQVAADYARALGPLGYIGPLNLNCKKIDSDHFVPYELNGRFTGTTATRAAFGHPEVEYALDYFLDGKKPKRRYQSKSNFMRQLVHRRPVPQLFDSVMVSQLITDGVWRRKS